MKERERGEETEGGREGVGREREGERKKKRKIMCVVNHFSGVWLCDPMDCNLPGSSVHGILQVRLPKRVAISFSRDGTLIS